MIGFDVALCVHFLSLFAAIGATAVTTYCAWRQRDARTPAEVAEFGKSIAGVVKIFPPAALGLLASGFYMAWIDRSLAAGWVIASIVGLLLIVAIGNAIEMPHGKAVRKTLMAEGLSDGVRRALVSPTIWTAKMVSKGLLVAVLCIMVAKPGPLASTLGLVLGIAAGFVVAAALRRPAAVPASVKVP